MFINRCIHQLFELQVEETPNNIAVIFEGKTLSYQELNYRANKIAHYLQSLGVGADTLVGICVERSLDMVIGLLGILKAGGAYLPLDASYPQKLLSSMLEDAQPAVLLTQQRSQKILPQHKGKVVYLDTDWEDIAQHSKDNPDISALPNNLAYVMYTSGSTGKPKGVLVEHQAFVRHSVSIAKHYNLQVTDKVLQFASINFDVAGEELFPTWLSGATVVLCSGSFPPSISEFQELIYNEKLTVLNLPASYWHEWVSALSTPQLQLLSTLRLVVVGNEKVLVDRLITWQKIVGNHVRWLNAYGITETTVTSTIYEPNLGTDLSDVKSVPIGRPIANTQVYLLDENKQPVLKGMTGELYIGGSGLARGYLNLPDLTNERFISNPFSDEPTSKLYKTGDLARVLADGNIEILGRVDNQVKVRGFRVQMEAIEAILNQHTLVEQSVVMCHTDKSGAQRLIAYILTTNNTEIELWPLPGDYRVYDGIMYYAMTYDYVRNKSYEVAIRELVKDKVVVDIGTGKDIVWAKFCAESGAKKVYAVEMQHEAYEYAKNYVEALGLSNTISVIYGDAIKVELPEKVDICVSELIGSIGNSEGAVSILNNARKLLKEDGIMIPQRCVTNIATVYLPEQQANHPKFTELSGYYAQQIFNKLGRKIPIRVSFKNFPQSNIISTIDVFEDIDFNQASNPEYDREIRLTITQSGKIDGFLLWLNLYTVENEIIDHLSYIGNCLPVYFPVFYPGIEVTQGDIIEAICSARLSEDRLNPDYHIQGYLVKQTGERIKFEYDSFLYKTPTNSNLFYERLLAQEPVLNKQTNPAELSHESLLAYLKEYLPAYMLPTEFIALNSFPLGVNGKINRKALPIPKGNKKIQKASFVAPRNSWEFRLTKIWENLLGIQPISVIDNFFDLGGNSLLALRLMLEIELSFGQKLSLSTLFPNSTIENIAKILSKTNLKPSNYSLIPIQPSGIKPPFFCVHPIGGNVFCYKDLGQHLGHDQPFYGLQCAGIDGEIKPKTSIEDMAAYYIEAIRTIQPQGPYLIGGWSFGGIVAFEMAQQLYLSNQEVALLALIDCWAPHQYIRKPAKVDNAVILAWLADDLGDSLGRKIRISVKQLQSLKGDKQLNYVLDKLKAANILPSSMGIGEIQRLLEIALLNRQAERNYSPQVYQHPITLFRGNDNIEPQDSDPTMGWKDLTNLLEIKQIPGNHYTIIKKPNIQVLVKQLKISLCQAIKCM